LAVIRICFAAAEPFVCNRFFQRRISRPVLDLLRQGTKPEEIALSIAVGLVLGIFPALGSTTLLCFLAALIFRVNLPAIQLVNYHAYPLQLALLIPFIRAGEFLFHSPRLLLSHKQIAAMIKANAWDATKVLWISTIQAIVVWALIAPPVIYVLYRALAPPLQKPALQTGLSKAVGGKESR
jgi:uncharacterized protein (DUF2062 family)